MRRVILNDTKLATMKIFCERFHSAQVLKYSPGKRCLFMVRSEEGEHFVKMYPKKFLRNKRGEKIHNIGQVLWDLSELRSVDFRVARPVRWDAETQTLWHQKLAGIAAIEFLKDGDKHQIVKRIGRKIAQIAGLNINPPRHFDRAEQMKDSQKNLAAVAKHFPELRFDTDEIGTEIKKLHSLIPVSEMLPSHGDMHIDQWLFDGNRLGLLDFEDFSLAEPERDLAFFIVHIEAEYGAALRMRKIEEELTSGFELFERTISRRVYLLYKAHKWLARAAKANGTSLAKTLLRRARRELGAISVT